MRRFSLPLVVALLLGGGCASPRTPVSKAPAEATPATRPGDSSLLTLDQIQPIPVLPQPTTRPSSEPPPQALQLYAQARAAQLEGDRNSAITYLRQALDLDRNSYFLNYALGTAYPPSSTNELAISKLQKAAELEPDHIDVQLQLGRHFLNRNDLDKAIHHLRLALQTSEYKSEPETAALVDLFLARALQQKGYDLAALKQYETLLGRMDGRLSLRGNPELYFILSRPEVIYMQVGELSEKHGQYDQALKSYRLAAEREPNNFDYQAHIVHALLGLRKTSEARSLAAELVSGYRASTQSLDLLRQVYRAIGKEGEMVEELRRIRKSRPGDRSIAFALADALSSSGHESDAQALLQELLNEAGPNSAVVQRLFDYYLDRKQPEKAALLLIEQASKKPETLAELETLWPRLDRDVSETRLSFHQLLQLQVPESAQAAKLFWISRAAYTQSQYNQARVSLEKAVSLFPPFSPAYRELMSATLSRTELSESQRDEAAKKLIDRAVAQGQPALASELRGLQFLQQKKSQDAVVAFDTALKLGMKSPSLELALATALASSGRDAQAEQTLWKAISDFPSYDNAYLALFNHLLSHNQARQAINLLQKWLASDPYSINARLLQARVMSQSERPEATEQLLSSVFREAPDNIEVVGHLIQFYNSNKRQDELLKKLADEFRIHPGNRAVAQALISLYEARKQRPEALAVLDQLHAAVAGDPLRLYSITRLSEQIGQRQMTEQILSEILKIDPHNATACNDLGYMWADEGRNLAEAESLVRKAVEAEPENGSFLDSLGWILYKRGKFEESRTCLDRALAALSGPEPVVLDHLGDVLYRLNQSGEAHKAWQKSLDQLSEETVSRSEYEKLRLHLKTKLRQQQDGQSVSVAPLAETASAQSKPDHD